MFNDSQLRDGIEESKRAKAPSPSGEKGKKKQRSVAKRTSSRRNRTGRQAAEEKQPMINPIASVFNKWLPKY